jgi:hypothetical protein
MAVGVMAGDCWDGCTRGKIATVWAGMVTAPVMQLIGSGLVIPGGLLRGRYDAWRDLGDGRERNSRALTIVGGVLFGVFTAASIGGRVGFTVGCSLSGFDSGCLSKGSLVGYQLGIQASDMLTTVGLGMMSYGIAHSNYSRTHGRVSVAPWGMPGSFGLGVSGRF